MEEEKKGKDERKRGRKKERPTTLPKHSPITTNITGYLHPTFLCVRPAGKRDR